MSTKPRVCSTYSASTTHTLYYSSLTPPPTPLAVTTCHHHHLPPPTHPPPGEGAYGKVYAGLNQVTGELMAVKTLQLLGRGGCSESQAQLQELKQVIIGCCCVIIQGLCVCLSVGVLGMRAGLIVLWSPLCAGRVPPLFVSYPVAAKQHHIYQTLLHHQCELTTATPPLTCNVALSQRRSWSATST